MNLETLDDIRNLINSGTETDSIEFKKTTGQLERGMETLCAFLNGTGGTVLFGVTDEGKIVGQDIAGKTKETIGEAVGRLEPNAHAGQRKKGHRFTRGKCGNGTPVLLQGTAVYAHRKCYHCNAAG